MSVWRIDAWMELDPGTPGMGSFDAKIRNYLSSDAITIALTNEDSFVESVIVTNGPPSGRRIWVSMRLVFTTRTPFDDIISDLFEVADSGPPPIYGNFLFPQNVLLVDPADPDPSRSFIIAHSCQHDSLPFSSCNDGTIVAEWREGS